MRVLVCGGREYQDYLRFARAMCALRDELGPFEAVIHGGAQGADWCAHLWANSPTGEISEIVFKADWATHGCKAGPIRNQQMLDEGKPDLVVAFPGGRGTDDMVRRAEKAGVPVKRIT
jgi:hypothetical protein